jgi:rhodanese-related sulfurtransferase
MAEFPTMQMKKLLVTVAGAVSLALLTFAHAEDTPTDDNGNRYNRDRQYHSEISAAAAYQEMMQNKSVIIDVRTRREYAAGHPERSYNIPYPNIDSGYSQDAATFYWEVYNLVNGDTEREIRTLCRTGSRSIDAANILADPQNTAGDPRRVPVPDGIPFDNVRNIWEGFVGRELFAFTGSGVPDPTVPLDLNNDGYINGDTADVYAHTKDANPDKDGWRNFQNLPWTSQILKPRAYMQDRRQYACWQTDEGC